MKFKLTTIVGGLILTSNFAWSQCTITGVTSPTCENSAVQTLSTDGAFLSGPGMTGNDFDPAAAGPGTHTITAYSTGTAYIVDQTGTFSPTPSTGTAVTLSDDQVSGALPIGFNFSFFGVSYSNFYISSNGFISFDPGVSQGCCSGLTIPANDAVNNIIAWSWNDLYPPGSGSISYETVGVAPYRVLLVTFTNQSHCCNTTGGNTGQIKLFESSNIIEIHDSSITNDGSTCTQGIENANGSIAYATPGRNSTTWTATNDYVAFIPSVPTNTYGVDSSWPYLPIPSTGTAVSLSDDQVSGALPIGFTFEFFGTTYTQFYISSNGFISFDPGVSQGCCSGGTIPSNDAVNNIVAWSWNDLYPPGGGSISYETVGIAPQRKLLVTFTNQSHCCNTSGGNTGQIILNESSNIVEIHCTSITNDGSNCTQGIEDATGSTAYYEAGRNSAVWTTTNDGIAFKPATPCTTVTIDVNPVLTGTDAATFCTGDTYTFGTQSLTTGGTYTEVFSSAVTGCDSTVTLTLTENPTLTGTDAATICTGDSYTFGTQTLTTGGTYTEIFSSAVTGCDSTVTLTLTENPTLTGTDAATICSGDSYTFGTQTLTTGGTYTEIFSSAVTGCDSTVTLTLAENPSYSEAITDSICTGDTLIFGSQTLTTGGTYTELFTTALGCDSSVTLTLIENTPPAISVVSTTDELTGNDGAIDIDVTGGSTYSYNWDNSATTQDISGLTGGVYTVVVTDDTTGCTSTESITVNSQVGLVDILDDLFVISPNPSNGIFNVALDKLGENMELVIINSAGQQILTQQITEKTTKVNINGVASGTYFVRVKSNEGVAIQPIIIE